MLKYVLTPIYLLGFYGILGIFHFLQIIARKSGGYKWHMRIASAMQYLIMKNINLSGNSCSIEYNEEIYPPDSSLILVANHQSMYDIPPIGWAFKDRSVKFVSKIELGKGIPSISYNLRHGKHALIDRKNSKQALSEILKLAKLAEKENLAVCIFPEGTRSRDGQLKRFSINGFKTLLSRMPSALVIPISVSNSYKLVENGWYPMPTGIEMKVKIHHSINPKNREAEEVLEEAKKIIERNLSQK
ncbi:lysophospholipid acyltransferase family protein [Aureibacter tunicatorum]|uniref:1-acyl-sn-glycerol-3-phosphate acyltransferase n=1 Tax=Aureibacter tunicatorum TaxID=866807 RepID=A0AAE3XQQ9_9BACT|nr:lysophospholipid acyltransferase family protein [Aureibacter tunicatorum]MDR6240323.1 1-acyl-sn-glycerol-3-phosphate acyltransferase [Aureibacter tunicatorum]BDD05796.1 1-acyl-sn-glycerol-3-phosphate acyltransferase [Aureibacter tunicatorum]